MSQWTHVCGAIRYDNMMLAISLPQFKEMVAERLAIKAPEPLPAGSEGPLTVTVHKRDETDGYDYMSTMLIIGDLCDFGNDELPTLEEWWERATTNLPNGILVRAAVLQVAVEGQEPIVWQHKLPDE